MLLIESQHCPLWRAHVYCWVWTEKRPFKYWSRDDSHVQVWDMQTGQLICKFQTFPVGEISPALIEDMQIWHLYKTLSYYCSHADLVADEYWNFTHGYELMSQNMVDGWVMMVQDDESLFWVTVKHREHLSVTLFRVVIEGFQYQQSWTCLLKALQNVDKMDRQRMVERTRAKGKCCWSKKTRRALSLVK